jgi:hypothetical protein
MFVVDNLPAPDHRAAGSRPEPVNKLCRRIDVPEHEIRITPRLEHAVPAGLSERQRCIARIALQGFLQRQSEQRSRHVHGKKR